MGIFVIYSSIVDMDPVGSFFLDPDPELSVPDPARMKEKIN